MYDRHKPIIKWYEYDATKLYRNADAEDVTEEAGSEMSSVAAEDTAAYADEQPAEEENTSVTGDPSMDDEVARIMAVFSGAKQNNVDDVFAAMAAQEEGTADGATGASSDDQEDLISSICAPKQNNVDDLVAMARGG